MVKRPTWIMVVVLAVLAALAYYTQQPDNLIKKALNAGTPTVDAASGQLIGLSDGTVNGISVAKTGGDSILLQRASAGWTMALNNGKPIAANQGDADQAASNAQYLNVAGKITSATANPAVYGLDKPSYILKLIMDSGKTLTFKIGNATLAADGYYAQKEDGSIIILDGSGLDPLLNLLKQPPYMFTLTPTESPATGTPTPTATLNITATADAGTPTGTLTPITELTPTKQP